MDEPVVIELFGIPRERAGRAQVEVPAGTVREILGHLGRACPGLAKLCRPDGRLAAEYLLSLDGRAFVTDLDQTIEPGTRLVLLSADVGG